MAKVIDTQFFTMSLMDVDGSKSLDRSSLDSFIIYIALCGDFKISADGKEESLANGELILVPAQCCDIEFEGNGQIMEVYIK